jgi:hypothetical protein
MRSEDLFRNYVNLGEIEENVGSFPGESAGDHTAHCGSCSIDDTGLLLKQHESSPRIP